MKEQMTRTDRVKAALSRKPTDRPPVSAWGHNFEIEWHPEPFAQFTVNSAQTYDWDWIKIHNRETCFVEGLGGGFAPHPSGQQSPILTKQLINQLSDWQGVIAQASTGELPPSLVEQVELVRRVKELSGGEWPILQTIFSPISIMNYLIGRDPAGIVEFVRENPVLASEVIQALTVLLRNFVKESLAAGADGIYYGIVGYASRALTEEQFYLEHLMPGDKAIVEAAESAWFNMLHICGSGIHSSLIDHVPTHAVSWANTDSENPSLAEIVQSTARAVVGGLDRNVPIRDGGPGASYEAARQAVIENDYPGFMLSAGCSVTPWPTLRADNFKALRWAAEAKSTKQ